MGEPWSALMSVLATAGVAIVAAPITRLVRSEVARFRGRSSASALDALSLLGRRMAHSTSSEEVLDEMTRLLAEITEGGWAEIWSGRGSGARLVSAWPQARVPAPSAAAGTSLEIPVLDRGQPVGRVVVDATTGSGAERRLVEDMARDAAAILRNAQLTSSLRTRRDRHALQAERLAESRASVVRTHDAARRRLQRDIHDGAQQHLVALLLQLRRAADGGVDSPTASQLRRTAKLAEAMVGALTTGVAPLALSIEGLEAAISRLAPATARVKVSDLGQVETEVEAALYFACAEALQNAAKHAPGSPVEVRLARRGAAIVLSVQDRGRGIASDVATRPAGGLANMRERIEEVGGSFELSSTGAGTTLRFRVPV